MKKNSKTFNIFHVFFENYCIKLDATKPPLAREGDFDTGNRSPLVPRARAPQNHQKSTSKFGLWGGGTSLSPSLEAAFHRLG